MNTLIKFNNTLNTNDALINETRANTNNLIIETIQFIKTEAIKANINNVKEAKGFLTSLKNSVEKEKQNSKYSKTFSLARKIIIEKLSIRFNLLTKVEIEKLIATNDFKEINSIYSKAKTATKKAQNEDEKLEISNTYKTECLELIAKYTEIKTTKVKVVKGKAV